VLYALVALGVVASTEGAVLWYLWTHYRKLQDDAAVSSAVASGLQTQLSSAYGDLAAARAALAKQNDLEAKADAKAVAGNPDLDAALARVNGL
jgi:hypothetical protein